MRSEASTAAASAVLPYVKSHRPSRVALFVSLRDEIDTKPLYDLLRAEAVEVVLPRVRVADTALDFVLAHDLNDLEPGPFRLLEPRGPAVPLHSVDIVVVPGLAFDKNGGRLGYGAGYYDRCLADFQGPLVGYCFAFQLIDDAVPMTAHDRHMTAIAHEAGVHIVGAA